jgi:hypothetical protein
MLVGAADGGNPAEVEAISRDYLVLVPPVWAPNGGILFFGHRQSESEKPNEWWIASLSGNAPTHILIPGLAQGAGIGLETLGWGRRPNGGASLIYSVRQGNAWTLFRTGLSKTGELVGTPEQLTSGTGLLPSASTSSEGKLVYEVVTRATQIFEIPVGKDGREAGPPAELPLAEGLLYHAPSASRNGRWIVYVEAEYGKRQKRLVLRDLAAGTNRVLDESPFDDDVGSASISPDGSLVVFNRHCRGTRNCRSLFVPTAGGEPRQLCENCTARGFSSDASFVLVQTYGGAVKGRDRIVAVDVATKRQREFLSDPDKGVYHPFLSWDDRWVVFKKQLGWMTAQLLIAPVRDGRPGTSAEWIAVTDGRYSDDKPQFSADGNTIYFTSIRDGYLCIWTQRLDPKTKHPVGAPEGYEHFHNSNGRDGASFPVMQAFSDLTVARDKMLISLPHAKRDLWIKELN